MFAVYVPYNTKVLDADAYSWSGEKWYDPFTSKNCEDIIFYKGRQLYPSASCDGEGMTFLIGDLSVGLSEDDIVPNGVTGVVTLVGNTQVSWHDIMASSIGGWQHLGWNANITNPAYTAIVGNSGQAWKDITVADMTRFNEIGPRVEGVFNVPICQTFDIRFFVGLQDANYGNPGVGLPDYGSFCLARAANSPAQKDQPFKDHVDPGLLNYMKEHQVWGGDTWVGDGWDKARA